MGWNHQLVIVAHFMFWKARGEFEATMVALGWNLTRSSCLYQWKCTPWHTFELECFVFFWVLQRIRLVSNLCWSNHCRMYIYIYYICNHIITAQDHWESNHHIYISLVDTNFVFLLSMWFRGHGGGTAGVWVTTNPSLENETWMKKYVYHTRVGMSLPPPEKLTARISQDMHVWIF